MLKMNVHMIGVRATLEGLEVKEIVEIYVFSEKYPEYNQRMDAIYDAFVFWMDQDIFPELELIPQ